MIDEKFAEAWINTAKHKVLGRRLKPFCLYYRFLLDFVESPFLTGGEATPMDLEIASRICSCRFGDVPSTKVSAFRLFMSVSGRNLELQARRFAAYIADHYSPPEFWSPESQAVSTKGGPPEDLNIAAACIQLGLYGGDEEKIWMMPLGKVRWYASAYHYHRGVDIDYVTEANRRMMKELKERLAREKAETETENGQE